MPKKDIALKKQEKIFLIGIFVLVTGCGLDTTGITGEFGHGGDRGGTSTDAAATSSGTSGAGGGGTGTGGATPCTPASTIPCYSGPPGTEGKGVCIAGVQTCLEDGTAFGPCEGEVVPVPEDCATPEDDDCNGQVNEGCPCEPFSTIPCYNGPAGTAGNGLCVEGTQTCDANGGGYGPCMGEVLPAAEDCATGEDESCDGQVNEGCPCNPDEVAPCYSGPAGTDGVGICTAGTQTCNAMGTAWGPCTGEVTPQAAELCATAEDDDCNGQANEICICVPNSTQYCYSGGPGTDGVGPCHGGTQTCSALGTSWSACAGEVLPAQETCDWIDEDCNGIVDDVIHKNVVELTSVPDAGDPTIAVANGALGIGWAKNGNVAYFGTADGNGVRVVGDTPFPTDNGAVSKTPSLVANGSGFAAIYADSLPRQRVSFATVSAGGVMTKSPSYVVGSGSAPGSTNETHLATNGNGLFFGVWDAGNVIFYGVWDGAGNLVGGASLSNTANTTSNAQALFDGTVFIGCWREDVGGSPVMKCQKVSTGGVLQGSAFQLSIGTVYGFRMTMGPAGPSAVWESAGSPDSATVGQFDAAFVNPAMTTIYGPLNGTNIAAVDIGWNGAEFAIGFVYTAGGIHTASVIRMLPNGTTAVQRDLWAWVGNAGSIRVAWDGTQWVLVWDHDTAGGRRLSWSAICGP